MTRKGLERLAGVACAVGLAAVSRPAEAAVVDPGECSNSDRFVLFEVPGWVADVPEDGVLAFAVERGSAGAL